VSGVLLNKKKYIYSYLKCIVYDKLLKPRQSFLISLYYCVFVGVNTVIIYFTFLAQVLEVAFLYTGLYLNSLSFLYFFNCLMTAYHKSRNV